MEIKIKKKELKILFFTLLFNIKCGPDWRHGELIYNIIILTARSKDDVITFYCGLIAVFELIDNLSMF